MRLDLFCVLLIGYFMQQSDAANQEKQVHINIHIPHLVHREYDDASDDKNGRIIIHSNEHTPEDDYTYNHNYDYNSEKKYNPKQKKAEKKKSKKPKKKKYGDDKDFKEVLQNYNSNPEKSSNDNGFKTSVHTEHYEVKKINPNARYPDEKYIIQGAYKVQETDPWGKPVTEFHKYDSPISKIAASILSNYDYTNTQPGHSDEYNKENERDHDKTQYGEKSDYNVEDYKDYGQKKKSQDYNEPKKVREYHYEVPNTRNNGKDYENGGYEEFVREKNAYYAAPQNYGPVQPSHDALHSKQGNNENKKQQIKVYVIPQVYGNFRTEDSKRVENTEKRPAQVEYTPPQDHDAVQKELEYEFEKEFEHLVDLGHDDSNYGYDKDWEKHLIDYVYGNDHAASYKFEQKVKPEKAKKPKI